MSLREDWKSTQPTTQETAVSAIIDAAISWHSADADRPDPLPPEWASITPMLLRAPAMALLLQGAVNRWGQAVAKDEPIDGCDAVQWLSEFITAAAPLLSPETVKDAPEEAKPSQGTPSSRPAGWELDFRP